MTLQAFCFLCLGAAVVVVLAGAFIEGELEYRRRQKKRVRELHAENARLKAKLGHKDFEAEYQLDALRTELAVKQLLLAQKWAGVKK